MKKILFISVHPDDETLGCGGTILRHKCNGDEIHWLIITGPTENHPYGFSNDFIIERQKLVCQVAEEYNFDKVTELNLPTQLLHSIDLRDLIIKIDERINEIKPQIVYMMFKHDVHSDHRIAFDAAYSCTKNFRKPFIERIYMYEVLSETEFSPALQATSFIPNVFIDVTDYFDKKIEIMKLYDTEIMTDYLPRSLNSIRALGRYRGSRLGVKYAEAFMLLFEKL